MAWQGLTSSGNEMHSLFPKEVWPCQDFPWLLQGMKQAVLSLKKSLAWHGPDSLQGINCAVYSRKKSGRVRLCPNFSGNEPRSFFLWKSQAWGNIGNYSDRANCTGQPSCSSIFWNSCLQNMRNLDNVRKCDFDFPTFDEALRRRLRMSGSEHVCGLLPDQSHNALGHCLNDSNRKWYFRHSKLNQVNMLFGK